MDNNYPGVFVPNLRTKLGREMSKFLEEKSRGASMLDVLDVLNLEIKRRFKFPFIEIVGDIIIIYLSDNMEPSDENLIEITKREFNDILSHL